MASIGKKISVFAFCLFGFGFLFGNSFTSSVDRTSLSIHEQLILTLQVVETDGEMPKPSLSQVPNFKIIGKSNFTSTSYRLVNGKSSSTKTFSYKYTLMPTKIGKFVIPPQRVVAGAKIYETKPIEITVTKNPANPTKSTDSPLYIKTNINKTTVYVGEKILVSYFVYTRYNVSGIRKVTDPVFDGFWSKQTFTATQVNFAQNIVNGVIYGKMQLASYQLTPQKAGTFELSPLVIVASVNLEDDFFSFGRTKDYRLVSLPQKVVVKDLPPSPSDFNGSIGKFTIESFVSSNEVAEGDAITYTIKVAGNGNFVDDFPKFAQNESYRFASPEITSQEGLNQAKYMVIAKKPGKFTIPAVTFRVFNPLTKKYEKLATKPATIKVKKSENSYDNFQSTGQGATAVKKKAEDIDFIITEPSLKEGKFWITDYRYWVLCASLIFFSLVLAKILNKKKDKNFDQDYLKKKESDLLFKKYMKEASALASSGSIEFYNAAHSGLLHCLCDLVSLDRGSTALEICDALSAKGFEVELISQIKDLINKFEQARFMPGAMVNIKEDYKSLKSLLRKIDR